MLDETSAPEAGVIIEREVVPGVSLLALVGEHDLATAAGLEAALGELVAEGSSIVVDVSEAEFVDLSILRALFSAHERAREAGIGLVVAWGTSAAVRRPFELTRMLDRVQHAQGRERALVAAQQMSAS